MKKLPGLVIALLGVLILAGLVACLIPTVKIISSVSSGGGGDGP